MICSVWTLIISACCAKQSMHAEILLRQKVYIEEALGMFLKVVAHGNAHWDISSQYPWSIETMNKCIKGIMMAICNLSLEIIRPWHTEGMYPHIEGNPKYDPWFNVCLTCHLFKKSWFIFVISKLACVIMLISCFSPRELYRCNWWHVHDSFGGAQGNSISLP